MNKGLITKLTGAVNDDSLLKIGELRISVFKVDTPSINTQRVSITTNQKANLTIIGDGYFTDPTFSQNKGKILAIEENTETSFFVSNNNVSLSLDNKYALTALTLPANFGFDISSLAYSKNYLQMNLSTTQVKGNISSLSNLTELSALNLSRTQVHGNISSLANLTNLVSLSLFRTQVKGDISSLSNLTNLTGLNLSNSQVHGSISSLSNMTKLITLNLDDTQVKGDISSLVNLTNLTTLSTPNLQVDLSVVARFNKLRYGYFKNGNIFGDLAKVPNTMYFISCVNSTTNLTWTARDSSASIIAIEGAPKIDNIDKMLQDLAQCKVDSSSYYKNITATGTRTSASDAAVQTLQSKGYTVSITPA